MERAAFLDMAAAEDRHWWFKGRRNILRNILKMQNLSPKAQILEAGCGSGGNLALLAEFGTVCAMEYDEPAREHAQKRGVATVEAGHLPDRIPFGDQRFDLIAVLDVLEHVTDDEGTLKALHARLKPGGKLLVTVPAFAFLWSAHDELHHHKRRYRQAPLIRMLRGAGYDVTFASYFNFFLFPLIALLRLLGGKGKAPGLKPPPAPLNGLLAQVFAAERFLLPYISLPFGVSILLVAEKPNA